MTYCIRICHSIGRSDFDKCIRASVRKILPNIRFVHNWTLRRYYCKYRKKNISQVIEFDWECPGDFFRNGNGLLRVAKRCFHSIRIEKRFGDENDSWIFESLQVKCKKWFRQLFEKYVKSSLGTCKRFYCETCSLVNEKHTFTTYRGYRLSGLFAFTLNGEWTMKWFFIDSTTN